MTDTKVGNILQMLMGNMSEGALAKAVNVPKATIHRVLSGITPDPRAGTLLPIAQYFNITIEQLMGIMELPKNSPLISTRSLDAVEMPFVLFDKLEEWLKENYKPEKFYEITSFGKKPIDTNCFITQMCSDEMAPLFSSKTYLIIRKQNNVNIDDVALVFNTNNNSFLVRKYIELKGEKYLFPANSSYNVVDFDHKIKLVGIVLEGRIII